MRAYEHHVHVSIYVGCKNVLVKLGSRGSMMITEKGAVITQAAIPPRQIVDTTGAGDCFTGLVAEPFSVFFLLMLHNFFRCLFVC